MNSDVALIACESVLDPILEQLTAVLEEHSANVAGPVADALERLPPSCLRLHFTGTDGWGVGAFTPRPPVPLSTQLCASKKRPMRHARSHWDHASQVLGGRPSAGATQSSVGSLAAVSRLLRFTTRASAR
jgi:hypothetical protein